MLYEVVHTTRFSYEAAVSRCLNEVHLTPRQLPLQQVRQSGLADGSNGHDSFIGIRQGSQVGLGQGQRTVVRTVIAAQLLQPKAQGVPLISRFPRPKEARQRDDRQHHDGNDDLSALQHEERHDATASAFHRPSGFGLLGSDARDRTDDAPERRLNAFGQIQASLRDAV
jgi:hypothetical protein